MESYELLGVIGQGQFGTAYKARHKGDGKLYCIKRIAMSSKEDVNDGLREAQLLSSLNHPNVIGYKESFVDKDSLCIVTTFCEEGDLFKLIRKRAVGKQYFSENEVMDMFMQIANGMMHIHQRKILHRDLKTQNIFMGKGGVIKLGDFGISKVLEKTDQFATTVTGTPYYMAPEICTNQPYTFKSDIWSLGCVLYELCTLKHAFAADSLLSLVYQIVRGNYPPIPSDIFSPDLAELINCMLQRDPAQRPALPQIFSIPYVARHMERFGREESRRLVHQRSSINHSRSNRIEQYALEAAELYSPHSQGTVSSDEDALTPKQRMQKRKEEENRKRNLELQVANINRRQEMVTVAQSKHKMHESNVFDMDKAKVTAAAQASWSAQPWQPPPPAAQPSFASWEYGARRPESPYSQRQNGMGDHDEDSVLMGTVTGRSSTQPSLRDPSPSSSINLQGGQRSQFKFGFDSAAAQNVASSGFKFGLEPGERSPACSQELFAQQQSSNIPNLAPGAQVKFGVSTDTMPRNSFNYIIPNGRAEPEQQQQQQQQQQALNPNAISPGGKVTFGVSTDSLPRNSFNFYPNSSAPPSANPQSFASLGSSLRINPDCRPLPPPNVAPSSYDYDPGRHEEEVDEYEDDFEGYDDDFEEYEDEGGPCEQVAAYKERVQGLQSFKEMKRTLGDGSSYPSSTMSGVQDQSSNLSKEAKQAALREKCLAALGVYFPEVYDYLRDVRSSREYIDERDVQATLLDIVDGDRQLLQGSFLCDQLVFQETMYR